jgi:hypothetical protein
MPIDFYSVSVATIVCWIITALWYSPLLFGAIYAKLLGEKKRSFTFVLLIALPILFVIATFLAILGFSLNVASFRDGMILGFLIWIGFVFPIRFFSFWLERKKGMLFLLEESIWLINLILLSGIIGG